MTFKEIIFKNFQQKFSHYAIYLFSLVISVVLYFSFITLKYAHHLHGNQNYPIIKEGSQIGSYFLFIIIIVFILYANLLFLKRRGREFALLQTIGLSRFNILQMIMIEQLFIFIATSILGIIIGIFGSKILLMIVLRLLGINITVSIIFSVSAILQAILLIVVAYILTIGQSYFYIRRRSIIELASNMTKREINHNRFTIGELILGVLGVLMILTGYYLSTTLVQHFNSIFQPFVILICTVIGAYFFFRSTVSLIFKAIKKVRQDTVSVNDVMFIAPIMYRIKKNAFSLTVMTIISAITVSVLCFAAISRGTLTNEVLLNSPHDVTLKDKEKANELAYELNNKNIEHFYNYKEVVYSKLFKDKLFEKGIAKPYEVSVTSDKYIPNVEVSKGYTDIIVPEGKVSDVMKYKKHGVTQLGTHQHDIKVKLNKEINQVYFMSDVDLGGPTLVLNDKDYQYLRNHTKAKNIVSQYGFDIKHKKDMPELQSAVKNVDKILKQEVKRQVKFLV